MPITSRSFNQNPVVKNIIGTEKSELLTAGTIPGPWMLQIDENGGVDYQLIQDADVQSLVKALNEANPYSYRCDKNPEASDWIVGVKFEHRDREEFNEGWLDQHLGASMCHGIVYGVSYQQLLDEALTERANASAEALTPEGKYPKSDVAINKAKMLIGRIINGQLSRAEELMVADIIARHLNQELDAALMQGEALNGMSDEDAEEMMNNQFMERVNLYADQLSEKKHANSQFIITAGPKV